jgi:hypothetical protein
MEVLMKRFFTFLFFLVLLASVSFAQSFTGTWRCAYATIDDQPNSTGYQTPSVAVISEDEFAALVNNSSGDNYYLVGYRNADSTNGRLGNYGYGSALGGYRTQWISGFDQVDVWDANDLDANAEGQIFVANNDVANNILVFTLGQDSVESTTLRVRTSDDLGTENDYLWAIDLDASNRVYVTRYDTLADQSSIIVIGDPSTEAAWADPLHPVVTPIQEIILPDGGEARGLTVNPEGTAIYVSNFDTRRIYRYVGDPVAGYTQDANFQFFLQDTLVNSFGDTLIGRPFDMKYMPVKNIVFLACDVDFDPLPSLSSGYPYARIYAVHPETGEILDTIDVAEWNFAVTGSYSGRPGQIGTASGYASTYNVDVDANFNIYSQSFYGWTAEKWVYSEELPVITGVEEIENVTPTEFSLSQNYPNPFNPSTTIEFSLVENSEVSLAIYSITGELVAYLIDSQEFSSGVYKVTFDASSLASGTYIYTLTNNNAKISKKMILLK